ncbi:glutathione S-transferase family protein [Sphingomonas fennica]|uniref:Glutathione-dependent reductase n=1 Tax=Edaphosphingomonas fennica TaxID=114404 RepID=A0A2T4HLX5_9SPHN|nr:glutathione S-transferase family protein [Sphingomonas fennica]PTD16789.1 glutathione-dependent reductase [Sphingomonas fennica]
MLIDGKWSAEWQPFQGADAKGRFVRKDSSFRNWVTRDGAPGPTGEGGFKAEPGRYHLTVALICPWASRTLMARALKGLEDVIGVSVANPHLGAFGWSFDPFPGADADPLLGAAHVHELYTAADPRYTGRATVPILWDKQRATIVNNESADILRMMTTGFGHLATRDADLYPADLASDIDALSEAIYAPLNNGVYRAGFAQSQEAYDEAVAGVFAMLDTLEARLATGGPYLLGERLTESDIRLFVTLIRFDVAYHGLFKCNIRRIADYPALSRYMARVRDLPGIEGTVNIDHIKHGYYSIKAINPSQIVPAGPLVPASRALRTAA